MFTIPTGVNPTSAVDFITTFNVEYWALQTAAMLITALLIPGLRVRGPISALLTVITLAVVNAKFWDAASFFALPNSWTVHAAVLVLANGILFWVIVKILPGIEVQGFLPALVAPLIFSACSLMVPEIARTIDWSVVWAQAIHILGLVRDVVRNPSSA